jgi:polyisoprenoid-binding protein YceI
MPSPDLLGTTRVWSVEGLDFEVDTALGPTIRGRFDRVGGAYALGADGARIELAVDPASVEIGNGIWDGLLWPADRRRLAEVQPVSFRSTRISDTGDGTLHVEGLLEVAGRVEPVEFDADPTEVDDGLRLEAAVEVDRRRLGAAADRFAFPLPATVHMTVRLGRRRR